MAHPSEVAASKACRRLFTKRGIDTTGCDIRVMHGVCHIRGVLAMVPGSNGEDDIRTSVQNIAMLIKRMADVRDVALSVIYKGERPG